MKLWMVYNTDFGLMIDYHLWHHALSNFGTSQILQKRPCGPVWYCSVGENWTLGVSWGPAWQFIIGMMGGFNMVQWFLLFKQPCDDGLQQPNFWHVTIRWYLGYGSGDILDWHWQLLFSWTGRWSSYTGPHNIGMSEDLSRETHVFIYWIAFGKPEGHREVAPREFDVHSR